MALTMFTGNDDEGTPQHATRRHPWSLQAKVQHKPTMAHRAAFAQVVGAPVGVTPDLFIAKLDEHLGYQYGFYDRCGGSHHQHDCSGYMCWAMSQLDIGIGCQSSFTIAQLCYDHALIIGAEEARATKAVFAFHGPNGGRGPSHARNGSDGHIVCGDGTGHTREAMGRRYGVVAGNWDGRNWVAYSKIPGVNYAPAPPPQEVDVITVQCDNKPAQNSGLDQPYAQFVDANAMFPIGAVVLHGCSINNDVAAGSSGLRVWIPTLRPGGSKWVSMMRKPSGNGVTMVDDKGQTSGTNAGNWS